MKEALSYRNESIDLQSKSMDWFLYHRGLHHQRVNAKLCNDRSSHQRCSVRKGVLRNFAKFIVKHFCLSLFFNKVAGSKLTVKTPVRRHLFYRTYLGDCFSNDQNFVSWMSFLTSSKILKKQLELILIEICFVRFVELKIGPNFSSRKIPFMDFRTLNTEWASYMTKSWLVKIENNFAFKLFFSFGKFSAPL